MKAFCGILTFAGLGVLAAASVAQSAVCQSSDLFCDPFFSYKAGWKQVRGKWEFSEQSLFQRSESGREGNALMYFDNLSLGDVEITTAVKMSYSLFTQTIEEDQPRIRRIRRVAGAGIVFRLQDENNYYMFRLAGEEGMVLGKMVDGEWYDLANPRAEGFMAGRLEYDTWYGLKVRVIGDQINCWIMEMAEEGGGRVVREQAVVSLRDPTFAVGRAGLSTFEISARFWYFRIIQK